MTRDPSQPTRRRKLVFTLAAVLLGFGAMELAARGWEAWGPSPERTIPSPGPYDQTLREFNERQGREAGELLSNGVVMVPHAERGWTLPRGRTGPTGAYTDHLDFGTAATNSLGLRGPELPPRREGELRLMSLGDSSIWGHGVPLEAIFLEHAATALTGRWGCLVTPVHGGMPGYDSRRSLALLRDKGGEIGPSWVIVGTLWSDVYSPNPEFARFADRERSSALLSRLAVFRLMRRWLAPWSRPVRVRWIASRDDVGSDPTGAFCRVALSDYLDNLEEIALEAEKLGARTAYLMLPAPMDFEPLPPPDTVMEYREAMRQVARRLDAPLIDGPAYFREAGAGIGWFADAVHPNAAGHALLGSAVADALGPETPPCAR